MGRKPDLGDGGAPGPMGRYGRFAAAAACLAAATAAVAALLPGDAAGAAAATAGCGISLAASLVAAWPIARMEARLGKVPPAALLAGSAVRPFVAIAGALGAVAAGVEPRAPLLVATAVSYLVLLVPDTLYARAAARRAGADAATNEDEAQ